MDDGGAEGRLAPFGMFAECMFAYGPGLRFGLGVAERILLGVKFGDRATL